MELKITGRTKEQFDFNLESFLNISAMICLWGKIPTKDDVKEAECLGRWWYKEKDNNRYQLSSTNNDWLNVRKEGENYIIVEFNFRYDSQFEKKKAITNLMLTFYDFVALVDDTK